jgi:cytochrome b involved in lipid metabolism
MSMEIIKSTGVTKDVKILIAILVVIFFFSAGVLRWFSMDSVPDDSETVLTQQPMEEKDMVAADPNNPPEPMEEKDMVAADPNKVIPMAKSVTLDEVMQHKSSADCHTIIRGGVYNISSFIEQHPDGKMNVENTCGMDSTKLFEGQYGGMLDKEEQLKGLFVGIFMKQ